MCSTCEKAIEQAVPEILWQMLLEKSFLRHLSTELLTVIDNSSSSSDTHRTLCFIECNAIRYTAGFIIRKIEQKFSRKKNKTTVDVHCVAALKEIAGRLTIQSSAEDGSDKWIRLVDRGGLYYMQDIVYDLFVTVEYFVDDKLSKILMERGKEIESIQKDQLTWVVDQDEVQLLWNQVDAASIVEDEAARRNLLLQIVHLWITTRGHSKTHKLKEEYKLKQKKSVKRTRSLRKELASES